MHKTNKCPTCYAFNVGGHLEAVYCGLWSCPRCARVNAREWAIRASLQVLEGEEPYYFLTLTFGSKYKTPIQAFIAMGGVWDAIRKWVKRSLGERRWLYLAFVEGQPRRGGMPHFHIISNQSVAQLATNRNAESQRKRYGGRKRIREKDWAVARGLGFEAKEEPVDSSGASYYVSKYATKQHPCTPRNFRRVRCSQGWHKLPPYRGGKLFVKRRSEHLSMYFLRVNQATGVDVELLYERWTNYGQPLT